MQKPFSQACENNKGPILAVLDRHFDGVRHVLEIGSGTGQHAVFFGAQLPRLVWQTSDRFETHAGISRWIDDAGLDNVRPPIELDVTVRPWPIHTTDVVFSANTAHIMSWPAVECLIRGVGGVLVAGGLFCLYGPFNYGGKHTSESNARFDQMLRERDRESGIRNFEELDALAVANGMRMIEDNPMPANNRLLIWRRNV